jgi:hypothetical protein
VAIGDAVFESGLEGKEAGGATHVAVLAKDFGAVLGIFFLKTKLLAESGQNIPTSCVPDPTCDILFFDAGAFKDGAGVAGGKGGNFRGEQITK